MEQMNRRVLLGTKTMNVFGFAPLLFITPMVSGHLKGWQKGLVLYFLCVMVKMRAFYPSRTCVLKNVHFNALHMPNPRFSPKNHKRVEVKRPDKLIFVTLFLMVDGSGQ